MCSGYFLKELTADHSTDELLTGTVAPSPQLLATEIGRLNNFRLLRPTHQSVLRHRSLCYVVEVDVFA